MNLPESRFWNPLARRAALGAALALALSCSKREEPPPAAAPAPKIAAAEPPRAPASALAIPEAPAAPAVGADLEKVAQNAAAFSDLVDSLRTFAGDGVEFNAATLDLESFVQGKSERDLFKFAQEARDKSPFAALQVLEYLWRQDLDVEYRLEIASLLGDLANEYGYEKDRAVARECVDWLADVCADSAQAAAMSVRERDDLICTLHRLAVNLDGHAYATEKRIADAIRASAQTDLELAYADEFDAFALMREGKAENVPAARAFFESMRARGVYGTFFALKMRVDHWLAFDDAAFAAEIRKLADITQKVRELNEVERRRRESMTPAELFAEMRRRAAEAKRPTQKDPP
jgi:hypothetical protein